MLRLQEDGTEPKLVKNVLDQTTCCFPLAVRPGDAGQNEGCSFLRGFQHLGPCLGARLRGHLRSHSAESARNLKRRAHRAGVACVQEGAGEVHHSAGYRGPLLKTGQIFERSGRVHKGRRHPVRIWTRVPGPWATQWP